MSSSFDEFEWSFSSLEVSWLHVILDSTARQCQNLVSDIYHDFISDIEKFGSCPDELDWFKSHGCKFCFHCIGNCSLCTAHFLLNPDVYRYTTLGDIDDPYLEIEKVLST